MKQQKHNGMRPQDIVIMLKIIGYNGAWQYRDLASSLFISISEISSSLNRSHIAGLVSEDKKKIHRQSLMEFLRYGIHFVFPEIPGTMITGTPTAHSHPLYAKQFISDIKYVWPDHEGKERGLAVYPLYEGAAKASKQDESLYLALASIDIIRVGKTREIKSALNQLERMIL